MDLFGEVLPSDPYTRFDTFGWAILNTFLVLTGEQWPTFYYACASVSLAGTSPHLNHVDKLPFVLSPGSSEY